MGKYAETIEKGLNLLILGGAVILDIYLEMHGKPVPTTVGLLAGFYLRHMMGVNGKATEIKP